MSKPIDPATGEAGASLPESPTAPHAPALGSAHRAEQQRRILAAATACFARDGFHGTSMQKICAEAQMSPGALYRYFASKEALIAAIVEGERAERARLLEDMCSAPSILEALAEGLRAMLAGELEACGALGPEIMAEAIRNTSLREAVEPVEQETRDRLREGLCDAQGRGEIDPGLDVDDVLILLQAMADGLILHGQLHPEWDLPGRASRFQHLVRRMLAPSRGGAE